MIRFSPNPNRANLIRWREWGDEAFRKAVEQDKPLMLFLTAFWCRFCQRMDEGAFSNDENIALLNAYFVTIRAEDTQRPDVNTRYNLNGWPTIAFMAPGGSFLAPRIIFRRKSSAVSWSASICSIRKRKMKSGQREARRLKLLPTQPPQ